MTEIRRASASDVPALAALQREGWEHDYVGYAPEGVAELSIAQYGTPAALDEQLDSYDVYNVAAEGSRIVGCICGVFDLDGGPEILWLHVQRAARGSGVGRDLIDSFIAALPPHIEHLYVTIFQDYGPTIAFYERLGFVEDSRSIEDFGDGLIVRHLRLRLELAQYRAPEAAG